MKKFMPELSTEERIKIFKDNAAAIDNNPYFRTLTDDELNDRRAAITENTFNVFKLEDELKVIKEEFKEKIKPIKQDTRTKVSEVKTGRAEFPGPLYLMADHDAGEMEFYNAAGDLVHTRKLKPEERQARLFVAGK